MVFTRILRLIQPQDFYQFKAILLYREDCGTQKMTVVRRDALPLIHVKKGWVPVKMTMDVLTTSSSSADPPTVKHLESSLMTSCTEISCCSAAPIIAVRGNKCYEDDQNI